MAGNTNLSVSEVDLKETLELLAERLQLPTGALGSALQHSACKAAPVKHIRAQGCSRADPSFQLKLLKCTRPGDLQWTRSTRPG